MHKWIEEHSSNTLGCQNVEYLYNGLLKLNVNRQSHHKEKLDKTSKCKLGIKLSILTFLCSSILKHGLCMAVIGRKSSLEVIDVHTTKPFTVKV